MKVPRAARRTALGILVLLVAGPLAIAAQRHGTPALDSPRERRVERVIDGDTLLLDGGERVRLLGVDTPESVHPTQPVERFGREAAAFTKQMVEGRSVRVVLDARAASRDKYGRTLAYVYLLDGTLLNLELIRQGYAHAYTREPFAMLELYRQAQREAREARRGLWADEDPDVSPPQQPRSGCKPRASCCKVCKKSRACGDACISRDVTCHTAAGCACEARELCS